MRPSASAASRSPSLSSSAAAAPNPTSAGHVLHARPAGPLLIAADSSGRSRRPRRTSSAPVPGGAAELVAADRQQVGAELVEGDRHVAGGLRGVDVDEHAPVAAGRHDLGHRLDRADLVVAPLHVDQRGVRADRVEHLVRRRPDRAGRPPTTVTSPARAAASRTAGVLDRRHHLMAAALGGAPHRGGDGLGRAAGEHDLAGAGAEQRRPPTPGPARRATRAVMPSVWIRPGSPPCRLAADRPSRRSPRGRTGEVDAWSR